MAISARTQQLLEQRRESAALRRFGGATRVMSGSSSLGDRASAIARRNTENELSIKTKQYNAGLIGNEEMKSFLTTLKNNPTLETQDKVDIEIQIQDFDDRIRVSKLEAIYKNAPDNSIQKIEAANALSNFYNSKAGSLASDSPAQSRAMEQAGQWQAVVQTETTQIQKQQRALKRAQLFKEVANAEPNSVDEVMQKAQAYMELASQARSDGDETAALQFETQAQNESNKVESIRTREEKQVLNENRKMVNDYINTALNDYKDGKISGDQMIATLQEADKFAADIGDVSIQVRLNSLANTVYRDIERGITYSPEGEFGIKSSVGGSGTGELMLTADGQLSFAGVSTGSSARSSGGIKTGGNGGLSTTPSSGPATLTSIDRGFQNEVKKIHQWFLDGQTPDGKRFTSKEYTTTLAMLTVDRQNDLKAVVTQLSQLNPDTKVKYKGQSTRIEELLKRYEQELVQISTEVNQLRNGQLVPVLETNKKGQSTLNLLPMDQLKNFQEDYIIDSQGVAHKAEREKVYFNTPEEEEEYLMNNPDAKIQTDNTVGKKYVMGKKYVTVRDMAGNQIKYEQDPTYGYLPIVEGDPKTNTVARDLQTLRDTIVKEADMAISSGQQYKPKQPFTPEQLQTFIEGMSEQAKPSSNVYRGLDVNTPLDPTMKGQKVPTEFFLPKVSLPDVPTEVISPAKVPEKIEMADNVPIGNTPQTQQVRQLEQQSRSGIQTPAIQPTVKPQTKLNIVGSQPQTPLQKVASQPQNKVNVPQSAGPQQLLKQTQPKQYTWGNLLTDIKNLPTKITSFFK